jgi:TPR repeat protein
MDGAHLLRAKIARLVRKIRNTASPNDKVESPDLGRRRSLQKRLEVALHRWAEVEQEDRIARLVNDAVKSGLVETAALVIPEEECPICMDSIDTAQMYCCGAYMCQRCLEQSTTEGCPFCRGDPCKIEGTEYAKLLPHAKAGKSWAQYAIALKLLGGSEVPVDVSAAADWFERAADQGNVPAIHHLGILYESEYPELAGKTHLSMEEKCNSCFLRAARLGHPWSQYMCAYLKGITNAEKVTWLALAVSQEYPEAMWVFSDLCYHGDLGLPKSIFASIYWLRKAALLIDRCAQMRLPERLIMAKAAIFDGAADLVGHSAIPEAVFWFEQGSKNFKEAEDAEFVKPAVLSVTNCACCGISGSSATVIRLCAQCRAVGYCGKPCQAKHWKMGHRADCNGVDQFRKALVVLTPEYLSSDMVLAVRQKSEKLKSRWQSSLKSEFGNFYCDNDGL